MKVQGREREELSLSAHPLWRDPSHWSDGSILGLLVLVAVLPYLNTLAHDFLYAYDDGAQILQNPYVHSFRYLRETFGTTVWSHAGAQGVTNYYRPLMTLGYLLTYLVFGPLPYGFHLVNVTLHTAVVALVFLAAQRMFRDRGTAVVAAVLFALHPVHTESVAWIAAVTDVQVTLFVLLSFWLYLELPRWHGWRAAVGRAGMIGAFVLALLAKEQALMMPLLATLYEHGFRVEREHTGWRAKLSRYGPLWLVAAAYVLFRLVFLGAFAPTIQRSDLARGEVLLSALALLGRYVGKLLWPVQLCAFYVFDKSTSLWELSVLTGVLVLTLAAVLVVKLRRRAPQASFAILWILITLAPVLNARWMAVNVFSERYLYLPSVGFCWLFGAGVMALWWRMPAGRPLLKAAMACALGGLAMFGVYRIVTRNRDWKNDVTLLTRTLADSPRAYRLHNLLGLAYSRAGDGAAAEREWRKVLEFDPRYASALNNLGMLYAQQKRFDEAGALFERAIELDPDYVFPYLNLGLLHAERQQVALAERYLEAAVRLAPLNFEIHNVLGKLCMDTGRLDDAEQHFRQSLATEPNLAALDHLGSLSLKRGDYARAEQLFSAALSLKPSDAQVRLHLGSVYALSGRPEAARREFESVLAMDPENADAQAAKKRLTAGKPALETVEH